MLPFNIKLSSKEQDVILEMLRWSVSEEDLFITTKDGYNFKAESNEDMFGLHRAIETEGRNIWHFNFIEGLLLLVAPALGMDTITLDLHDPDTLYKTVHERYLGYLNSEVGEKRS